MNQGDCDETESDLYDRGTEKNGRCQLTIKDNAADGITAITLTDAGT
ncbi:MAG: hypothetical protein MJ065_03755 [Oscillospiraceae bacterium]|nr:hypothetical protein [Oscillospiraceae bacterium]